MFASFFFIFPTANPETRQVGSEVMVFFRQLYFIIIHATRAIPTKISNIGPGDSGFARRFSFFSIRLYSPFFFKLIFFPDSLQGETAASETPGRDVSRLIKP